MVIMARDHPSFFEKVGECYSIICNAACNHRVKIRSGFMSIALSVKAVEGATMSLAPNIELARRAKTVVLREHVRRRLYMLLTGADYYSASGASGADRFREP